MLTFSSARRTLLAAGVRRDTEESARSAISASSRRWTLSAHQTRAPRRSQAGSVQHSRADPPSLPGAADWAERAAPKFCVIIWAGRATVTESLPHQPTWKVATAASLWLAVGLRGPEWLQPLSGSSCRTVRGAGLWSGHGAWELSAPHLGLGGGFNPSLCRKFSVLDVTTPLRPAHWHLGAGLANVFP